MSDKTMYLTVSLRTFSICCYTLEFPNAHIIIEYLRSIYCISACTGVRKQLFYNSVACRVLPLLKCLRRTGLSVFFKPPIGEIVPKNNNLKTIRNGQWIYW